MYSTPTQDCTCILSRLFQQAEEGAFLAILGENIANWIKEDTKNACIYDKISEKMHSFKVMLQGDAIHLWMAVVIYREKKT